VVVAELDEARERDTEALRRFHERARRGESAESQQPPPVSSASGKRVPSPTRRASTGS
jgi:hypothetical protein